MEPLTIPVSLGELIDKITILEIKVERFQGVALTHVERELALLVSVLQQADVTPDPELLASLRQVNRALWSIEDAIRDHERRGDFQSGFIALARSVYVENDRRAALKRALNERHGSWLVEEKSYSAY